MDTSSGAYELNHQCKYSLCVCVCVRACACACVCVCVCVCVMRVSTLSLIIDITQPYITFKSIKSKRIHC